MSECEVHDYVLVFKEHEAAGRRYYKECNSCGLVSMALRSKEIDPKKAIPIRNIRHDRWKLEAEERDRAKLDERDEWFRQHNEYLRSDAWKALRSKVMTREAGLCQGCREDIGTEVHHLNYTRWKRESLIDLVLLCHACHEHITLTNREASVVR